MFGRDLPLSPATIAADTRRATQALLRQTWVRELLRAHPDLVEADPRGEPVRRQEILWISPAPAVLDAALGLGFSVVREQNLDALNLRQLVLRPPKGRSTADALAQLRGLQPDTDVDFNHLYAPGGEPGGASGAMVFVAEATTSRRVGLIDGGVDPVHPALSAVAVRAWGCNGKRVVDPHGTAVASLLVGHAPGFDSIGSSDVLYAADIYCGQPAGGAADAIAEALAWMAQERVAVINVSLVGPPNRWLERTVQALIRKGHLIVAAVGNDGPAAAALYPAAYAGVVGITGVSKAQRALPEAGQGAHVMFSAPGADMVAAKPGGNYVVVRGTSFAAPIVAALLAQRLQQPDTQGAAAALQWLLAQAVDLGAVGRDPIYGWGLVGEAGRVAPQRVGLQR